MSSKQKTLHSASGILAGIAVCAGLWISCIASSDALQAADTGPQALGAQVTKLRLLAEAGLTNGRYSAGVEIAMQPDAHTYWKQPGDAGVPPVFSFNGSQNVAKAEVIFPTPKRISEGGIEAFGYTGHVVFPVEVTPVDASRPAVLKADVTYAVCRKICLPGHDVASIDLRPHGKGLDGRQVAAAIGDVPMPMSAAERSELSITPVKGATKPTWTLTWSGHDPVEDMFADAPEGFYFETRKLAAGKFNLVAAQTVTASKTTSVPVSLTLARKTHSLVTVRDLDVTGSTN